MSEKTISAEKIAKRKEKEAKEIRRLEREQAKPRGHAYLYYLMAIISVVYISDEVASQIGTQMQSVIAQNIFAPVFGPDMAVARMSALGSLSLLAFVLAFMYKPLADRYGRKHFLVLNTLGMGLGLFFISVSTNIPVYILGAFVIALFIPHDMQVVYILESTPPKHRAKIYSIIKAIATVGMMMIPLLRDFFMGSDTSNWRLVYLVPAIVAAGAALFALCFARETDAFVAERLEYLRTDEADRGKTTEQAQGGFLTALKFCLGNKQLRWLMVGGGFLMWGGLMTMYYETTMTYGYAAQFLEQGMELKQAQANAAPFVTRALFLFPIGSASFQLIQGFLSDKWGRKPTVIVMSVCALSSFGLFFLGARQNWNPYLVGLLCGSAIGSYWASGDVAGGIMCSESTPTNLRTSVLSVQPILNTLFGGIAIITGLVLINLFGDAYTGLISLCIAMPGILVGLIIISWKVRETKNVNLKEITGNE